MSVIGPRPGLWNQDVLIAERDKYGANDVKPGLTGWAQINGRDVDIEIRYDKLPYYLRSIYSLAWNYLNFDWHLFLNVQCILRCDKNHLSLVRHIQVLWIQLCSWIKSK